MTGQRAERTRQPPPTTPGRRFVAEMFGTFTFVLVGAGSETVARLATYGGHTLIGANHWLFVALAHGLVLFVVNMIIRNVSGAHVNPAVTIGLAIARQFPLRSVPVQLVAQFIGAVIGAAAILILYGRDAATIGRLGAPDLAIGTSLFQGFVIEALGTGIIAATVIGTANDPRAPNSWAGLATGMALAADTLFMGPVTGATFNPARVFGPDLVDLVFGIFQSWQAFLVIYLLGPIIGAIAACWFYIYLSRLPRRARLLGARHLPPAP